LLDDSSVRLTVWACGRFANTRLSFQKQKLSSATISNRLATLRFFYIKRLKKVWSVAETPFPKRVLRFPTILSQEEVTQLIDAALTPYHRILLMTLYATGVPNAELTHLKVSDIDSERMVIHIQIRANSWQVG
jgi:integrase/recombinase XerD